MHILQATNDPAQVLAQDSFTSIQRQQMVQYLGQGMGNRQLLGIVPPMAAPAAVQRQAAPAQTAAAAPQAAQAEAAPAASQARDLSWGERAARWAFEKAVAAAGVEPAQVHGLIDRAGGAITEIIKDPGRFVNTMIKAVGQGFTQFKDNISAHLQKGLMGWLFGTLTKAGIQLPKDFSLKSILTPVLQVLGITVEAMKQKAARFIGEKNVRRIEKLWDILSTFMKEGIGGLWEMLKDYLGDLKEMVVSEVKSWVITQVIQAAVVKVLSMFNPVSGLITVIKTIYNVIKFLVERAGQIAALFQAITGSVAELALGNVKGAADKVEQALGRVVPVAIGLLASLLGIGGIAEKVKEIIKRIQIRVDQAIDKVIQKIAGGIKKAFGKGKEPGKGVENKDDNSRVDTGLAAIHAEEAELAHDGGLSREEAEKVARNTMRKHPVFAIVKVVDGGSKWDYSYTLVQPTKEKGQQPKKAVETIQDIDFGPRPGFRRSTRRALKVNQGEHRRHLVAFDALHVRLKLWVQGKTVTQARQVLQRLLQKHRLNHKVISTRNGIIEAGRVYLRTKLNDLRNLEVGPGSENSSLGSQSRHAKDKVEQALESGKLLEFKHALARLRQTWLDENETKQARLIDRNVIDNVLGFYRREFARRHIKKI